MKLKLSEMASIAEVVGAIAVVISLVYVGVQVRDTNRAVRSAAINDANISLQAWYLMMSSDPEGIETFLSGILGTEPLSRNEEFRYMMQTQSAFYAYQNIFLLGQEGTLDNDAMASLVGGVQAGRNTPGLRRFWSQRRGYFHKDFVDYIEKLMDDPELPDGIPDLYRQPTPAQN